MRFADVETIRQLSGQHMVPILLDGDRVVHDSWNIACHLEERFPELPSLFGGKTGRGLARLVNHWSDAVLGTAVRRLIAADFILCLAPEDREYYRRLPGSRLRLHPRGILLGPVPLVEHFAAVTAPLERMLGEQPYFAGTSPDYADYLLFSAFQYMRLGCPDEFVAEGTVLPCGAGAMGLR